jgi:hypothetical protein
VLYQLVDSNLVDMHGSNNIVKLVKDQFYSSIVTENLNVPFIARYFNTWCSVLLTKYSYYLGDQIEKNEKGGASSTYGGKERCIKGFGAEAWGKENTWETQA